MMMYLIDIDINSISSNNWSNETHFTWFLYSPWKHRNDLFNDKPDENSGSIIFFPSLIELKNKRKKGNSNDRYNLDYRY